MTLATDRRGCPGPCERRSPASFPQGSSPRALLRLDPHHDRGASATSWRSWCRRPRGVSSRDSSRPLCSFLALNFFFTPPLHTFAVEETADLVALAVFLAVSATVGTMLSRVLDNVPVRNDESGGSAAASPRHPAAVRGADRGGAPESRQLGQGALRSRAMRDRPVSWRPARSSRRARAATPMGVARKSSRSPYRIGSSAASSRFPTGPTRR